MAKPAKLGRGYHAALAEMVHHARAPGQKLRSLKGKQVTPPFAHASSGYGNPSEQALG